MIILDCLDNILIYSKLVLGECIIFACGVFRRIHCGNFRMMCNFPGGKSNWAQIAVIFGC